LNDYVGPGYVSYDPMLGPQSLEAEKQFVQTLRAAVPDLRLTVEDIVAEGDKVCIKWRGKGTHRGEFMGAPATNRPIEIHGIGIMRLQGGKIVEATTELDTLGFMQQFGLVSKPAPRPAQLGKEARPS
jgi:steroid delta-isomerase-like uncharacterized protein